MLDKAKSHRTCEAINKQKAKSVLNQSAPIHSPQPIARGTPDTYQAGTTASCWANAQSISND